MAIKLHQSFAIHPGPWLQRQFVKPNRLSVSSTAVHLGVGRVTMSNLLNGHSALSPDMAIRFEKAFGVSAKTLLRMQAAYDLAIAEQKANTIDVKRVRELEEP